MSLDKIVPFEQPELSQAAALVVEEIARLELNHAQAVAAVRSSLEVQSLNLDQIIKSLSRNGKSNLLEELSNRLTTGIHGLNLVRGNEVETSTKLESLVTDIAKIWEQRRD